MDIDDPGGWGDYCYQATSSKEGKYTGHQVPGGATVAPGTGAVRNAGNGWSIHYDGWEGGEDTLWRDGTAEERAACLDADLLKKLGMTASKMDSGGGLPDGLFF